MLRELHRSAAVQAVALVCLVLLFAFIGPFGTYDSLGMGDRIGYWALAMGGNWLVCAAMMMLAVVTVGGASLRRRTLVAAGTAPLAAAPGTGVVYGAEALLRPAYSEPVDAPTIYLSVTVTVLMLVIGLSVVVVLEVPSLTSSHPSGRRILVRLRAPSYPSDIQDSSEEDRDGTGKAADEKGEEGSWFPLRRGAQRPRDRDTLRYRAALGGVGPGAVRGVRAELARGPRHGRRGAGGRALSGARASRAAAGGGLVEGRDGPVRARRSARNAAQTVSGRTALPARIPPSALKTRSSTAPDSFVPYSSADKKQR